MPPRSFLKQLTYAQNNLRNIHEGPLKPLGSYKRIGALLAAFLGVSALAAGFLVVSGRAEESGFPWPGSFTGIFGNRNSASASVPVAPPLAAASVVYVDDDWVAVPNGTDPDGIGPATEMGFDAFATIQGGINAVATGGQVIVAAGSYVENPTITRAMTLKGAQFGVDARGRVASESFVRTNGNALAVFAVTAANVTIDGFSIDGDDPGLAGVALASGDNANVSYGVRPTGEAAI